MTKRTFFTIVIAIVLIAVLWVLGELSSLSKVNDTKMKLTFECELFQKESAKEIVRLAMHQARHLLSDVMYGRLRERMEQIEHPRGLIGSSDSYTKMLKDMVKVLERPTNVLDVNYVTSYPAGELITLVIDAEILIRQIPSYEDIGDAENLDEVKEYRRTLEDVNRPAVTRLLQDLGDYSGPSVRPVWYKPVKDYIHDYNL